MHGRYGCDGSVAFLSFSTVRESLLVTRRVKVNPTSHVTKHMILHIPDLVKPTRARPVTRRPAL